MNPTRVPPHDRAAAVKLPPIVRATLGNGLRVIVHERRRVPVVAINMWYAVGARDEPAGRTGMAHLLEHMMFKGSARFPKGEIDRLTQVSGGDNNAVTWTDFTAYMFNLPTAAWQHALAVEADRMTGCTFADEDFAAEQQVVLAELRESLDDPWTRLAQSADVAFYGDGHPYAHPVVGYEADVAALTVDQLRAFYAEHYRPDRAVLVIVGDVDAQEAIAAADRHVGGLGVPGPSHVGELVPRLQRPAGQPVIVAADVQVERFYLSCVAPSLLDADAPAVRILDTLLSQGESSRLWRELVDRTRVASDIGTLLLARPLAGELSIHGECAPGKPLEAVLEQVERVLDELMRDGPDEREVQKTKNQLAASVALGLDTAGDIAAAIGEAEVTLGSCERADEFMAQMMAVTAADVQRVAQQIFGEGKARQLTRLQPAAPGEPGTLVPGGESDESAESGDGWDADDACDDERNADRSSPPGTDVPGSPGRAPAGVVGPLARDIVRTRGFDIERVTLDNGLRVWVTHRPESPGFVARIDFGPTWLSLPRGKAGMLRLLGDMLDEGTATRSADEIKELADFLGIGFDLGADGGAIRALRADADVSFDLLADSLLRPTLPADALEHRREEHLADHAATLDSPDSIARRMLSRLVYPPDHPAGQLRTTASLESVTRDDLATFHASCFRPDGAILAIAGALHPDDALALAQQHFGSHALPRAAAPTSALPELTFTDPAWQWLHMPDRAACSVYLGHLGIPRSCPDYMPLLVMDHILGTGAGFTDRISADLRDSRGLAYSVNASICSSARVVPGLFRAFINTAPEHVEPAVAAIRGHIERLQHEPPTADELAAVVSWLRGSSVFAWESLTGLVRLMIHLHTYNLPADWIDRFPNAVQAVTADQVQRAAQQYLHADRLNVAVVGPRQ
ncbi:MAG: M16 family metallopeptidase [Planctomycetota bacterium]